MIFPSDEERRLVTELLNEKPFECHNVFFFRLEQEKPVPLDAESEKLYRRDHEIVDALPQCEPMEDWAGNIVEGSREGARAYFYASYRFDRVMLVVSKVVDVRPDQTSVDSPFNKYFVDAIAARIAPILGRPAPCRAVPARHKLPEGTRTMPFNELAAWRQCKHLWRKRFGADVWIAVKGTLPIARAKTVEELDKQVRALNADPPLLYAPPEGEEKVYDIVSTFGKRP